MEYTVEKVHTVIDPKVMNDFDRANRKLKAIAKSFELTRRVIISASKIIWYTLRGRSRLAFKRNHYMNVNKKPQLRKTK